MCLLITGSSNKIREQLLGTPLLIENIYGNNGDGLGIMYATDEGLCTIKGLPAAAAGFREMVEALPHDDREVALHARWRTHGDIDLDNCHPYQVSETTFMMHNGILGTGNDADPTKSDTWHFAKDYLAGLPDDVLHKASFAEMLGDFIGNNKFAIMSADGRLTVVNKEQGISHDGVWYSNTYAWSPALLIPGYGTRKGRVKGVYYGGMDTDDWWGGYSDFSGRKWGHLDKGGMDGAGALMIGNAGAGAGGSAKKSAEVFEVATEGSHLSDDELHVLYDNIEECLYQFDSSTLADILEQEFDATTKYILDNYVVTEYIRFRPDDYSIAYCAAVKAWCTGNAEALGSINPTIVAETLIQCCDFEYIEDAVGDNEKPTAEAPAVEGAPSLSLAQ